MNFVVVSTALRPSPAVRARCEDSVKAQSAPARHIYLADEQGGFHLENLYGAVHGLEPSDVVLSLDGDDWLLNPHAIEVIAQAYDRGAWMTWGQYAQFENGTRRKLGHARDAKDRRACRREPWYASHLKTYRAGLFQQIGKEALQRDGAWLPECCDMAVMFPMLEMSDERGTFIPTTLYAYDYTDRRARRHDVPGTPLYLRQKACVAYVRRLPVYPRLEVTPW